ncbi:MAG: hypothetical protein EBU40_10770 [Proteobacteria bacterium]|nr:hypothetical protein [Pseudomonadota bacterium]
MRYLRDGLEIGPGLAEKWESNADASEWTLYFRKGLKWSDGHPWSVDDILFWWEDQVKVEELKEYPPDEARSGKGTLMTMTKIDATTLKLTYDADGPEALHDPVPHQVQHCAGQGQLDRYVSADASLSHQSGMSHDDRVDAGELREGPVHQVGAQSVLLVRGFGWQPVALSRPYRAHKLPGP